MISRTGLVEVLSELDDTIHQVRLDKNRILVTWNGKESVLIEDPGTKDDSSISSLIGKIQSLEVALGYITLDITDLAKEIKNDDITFSPDKRLETNGKKLKNIMIEIRDINDTLRGMI